MLDPGHPTAWAAKKVRLRYTLRKELATSLFRSDPCRTWGGSSGGDLLQEGVPGMGEHR